MRIFLDDLRDPEEWLPNMGWFRGRDPKELGEWAWIKSAFEAITLLETGHVVEVSLDFDLGDRDEVGDGYLVVTWVEERVAMDDDYIPPILHVHSSNMAGRQRLEAAVASIERLVARRAG
ncbi:MAG: hypothetical protein M3P18_17890 [Actinomycetota bacterium]|nr:hypothetical protein [Actinomycetota bacterium]